MLRISHSHVVSLLCNSKAQINSPSLVILPPLHAVSSIALNAGLVGLGLTYTISLASYFEYCIRVSAEVENVVSDMLVCHTICECDIHIALCIYIHTLTCSHTHTHTHTQITCTPNQMISAERVMAYGRLEAEASLETRPPHPKPPMDWPDKGGLEMEEVSFRYSENYPLVLKSLSFSIKPSEKVGGLSCHFGR